MFLGWGPIKNYPIYIMCVLGVTKNCSLKVLTFFLKRNWKIFQIFKCSDTKLTSLSFNFTTDNINTWKDTIHVLKGHFFKDYLVNLPFNQTVMSD